MNKLLTESRNNRLLYRELFYKANDSIKKQINALKSVSYCSKCKLCCQMRYSDLSPDKIFELAQQGESISKTFIDLFIPYSESSEFVYSKDSLFENELNNKMAKQINEDYVEEVLSKTSGPVYFYYCKHLSDERVCSKHKNQNFLCAAFPNSVTTILPKQCGYREWQKLSLYLLENDISQDVYNKLQEIQQYRESFGCKMTGTCCRLASSEFSYEELKQKAIQGDKYASSFTSVFIPYEDVEEAREVFPEFVDMLYQSLGEDEKVYFYHCPHLTENNLCSIYENRPDVCREFPNNPLAILPPGCGFCQWKEDTHVGAMLLHALVEIIGFNKGKIENALK